MFALHPERLTAKLERLKQQTPNLGYDVMRRSATVNVQYTQVLFHNTS